MRVRGIESSAVPHPAPQSPHFRGRVAKARFRGGHETKQVAWNRAIPEVYPWKSSISLSDNHSA